MPPYDLTLTVMSQSSIINQRVVGLVSAFEVAHGLQVDLQFLDWAHAWTDMVRTAINRQGPDVSQIGSTWLSDLARMQALRPFSSADLAGLGCAEAFSPATFGTCQVAVPPGPPEAWAAPYFGDCRLIFYRRDWLARAGRDPATAFATPAQLHATLLALRTAGHPAPWSVITTHSHHHLQNIVSWVWQAGGEIVDPLTHTMQLDSPLAQAGLEAYFALRAFLPHHLLTPEMSHARFISGEAAVTVAGPWLLAELSPLPGWQELIGVAQMPGPSFLGGSHLVVWRHSPQERAALALVRYLTSPEAQAALAEVNLVPVRQAVLNSQAYRAEALHRAFVSAIDHGRAFPIFPLWGTVEDQLATAFTRIWRELHAQSNASVATVIHDQLAPALRRLNLMLRQSTPA